MLTKELSCNTVFSFYLFWENSQKISLSLTPTLKKYIIIYKNNKHKKAFQLWKLLNKLELKQSIRIPDLTSACTSNKYFYSIKTLKLVIN